MGICLESERVVGVELRSESLILGQDGHDHIFSYRVGGSVPDSVELSYEGFLAALDVLTDPENREGVQRNFPEVLERLNLEQPR